MSGDASGSLRAQQDAGDTSALTVTLVIPGRNVERTLARCLETATRLLATGQLTEIVFVDDGSTDSTLAIARRFDVTCLEAGGLGPGGARNVGWRHASSDLVWFIDADCVVHEGALDQLMTALAEPRVAGVGGSYANAVPDSLLARLIHAEIRDRHLRTRSQEIDYLGSFNVLYRRSVLEQVGGFDETWVNGPGAPGGEDADLSYRVVSAGYALRLCPRARVGHHHPISISGYLRAQRLHGFWGVRLYRRHPARGRGNSYSGLIDHLQPVMAMASLALLPFLVMPRLGWIPALMLGVLAASTLPLTLRLVRTRGLEMMAFAPLATIRAFARGLGLAWGVVDMVAPGRRTPSR